jgi:hypothetical protein
LAIAGALLTAVASGPAGAETPASYTGSASGYALKIGVGPQNLTAGSSSATAASTGAGEATGAGVLSPIQESTVATIKNPPGGTVPEKCGSDALNALTAPLSEILSLGLGCGSASATGSALTTTSTATGTVGKLGVDVSPILAELPGGVAPQLVGGVQQVTDAVNEVCTAIPGAIPLVPVSSICTAVGATVNTVVASATTTKLLSAEVGTSTSNVTLPTATSVTSESTASGAIVKIVPVPVVNGVNLPEALATITVSRANAKVVCDLGSGNATPAFDPAIVRVKLGDPLKGILPIDVPDPIPAINLPANDLFAPILDPKVSYVNGELTITPGATVTLLPGTPAETEIVVGNGSSKVNPDRSATATADGVKIHALKNIGTAVAPLDGGVIVNLAHAEAAGACVAAAADAPATPTVTDTPRELPRTGGTPWLPIAGVTALAAAVVTRRALVRSN